MKKSTPPHMHGEPVKPPSKLGRFILLLIVVGGIGLIFLAAKFIYSSVLPQSNLAEHLPAEGTVAYLEMEGMELPAKLSAKVDQTKFMSFLSQLVGFDLKPAVNAFGTGKIAYVLLDTEGETNKPVIFIQTKTKGAAVSYFKGMLLEGETLSESADENKIYSFEQGQPYSFKFLDRYVAISSEEKVLKTLKSKPEKSLSTDGTYSKSINNLPRNKWISGYVDMSKVSLAEDNALRNLVTPLKDAMHNFAFAVRKEEDGFHFNTYLSVNKDLLSLTTENKAAKFTHQLTDWIPAENLALYVGGENLAEEWVNTLDTISNLNPSYGIILEGLLRGQTDKIFGTNVDLRNDLYPLFEGEYALMLGKGTQSNEMELILAHDDKAFVGKKMEKMAQGFESIASSFAPKVSLVTLPDGTESKELVPDDAKLNKSTEKINDQDVNCTEVGTKVAFCYTVTDDLVIMASSKKLLEESLKPSENAMLSDQAGFKKTTANVSKVTDEITFMNFDHLSSYLADKPYIQLLQPVLANFDSASWVKQYFDDGVSAEGYVLLK